MRRVAGRVEASARSGRRVKRRRKETTTSVDGNALFKHLGNSEVHPEKARQLGAPKGGRALSSSSSNCGSPSPNALASIGHSPHFTPAYYDGSYSWPMREQQYLQSCYFPALADSHHGPPPRFPRLHILQRPTNRLQSIVILLVNYWPYTASVNQA